MDDHALRVFLSLCETESTRDTGAEMGLAQSTVSRCLARLEAELGSRVFERRGRRLQLNPRGAIFREDARRIIEAIGAARHHAATDDEDVVVRVGFVPSTGRWLLPRIVAHYRSTSPSAGFELRADFARELFRLVREDVLDVAIVTAPPADDTDLMWAPICDEPLGVAMPLGHPLASRLNVTIAELADEPFIAYSSATEFRSLVSAYLVRHGVRPTVVFESGELDTIRGLVRAGLGVAVMPTMPALDTGFEVVPLEPPITRTLGVTWRSDARRSVVAERFLDHLRSAGTDNPVA